MSKMIHPVAGATALLMIALFWGATLWAELIGPPAALVAVKTLIPWGFLILIPAMAAVGGTGMALAGARRGGLIGAKLKRMPIIAANGVLVLVPAALFLSARAQAGQIDMAFYAVQGIELVAGAVNLTLLALNMRDGRKMTRHRRARA